MSVSYAGKLAVLCLNPEALSAHQDLAGRLNLPLRISGSASEPYFLTWRDGCLKLIDHELVKQGGLYVDVMPRPGEQRSWPAPKDGLFAQALGRKTQTVVDATTGWGQDSLHMFRMGLDVWCFERSPLMAELLSDGWRRLAELDWFIRLGLTAPMLMAKSAILGLTELNFTPECVYLDPMFPAKRKKSALARKNMRVLHELLGSDDDKHELFEVAWQTAGKRVVVKLPDYAEPISGTPSQRLQGKLLRYDVYLKNG